MGNKLLIQTQMSNYNSEGIYNLVGDSGWNMVINRVLVMLKMNKELEVDILVPADIQVVQQPEEIVEGYDNFERVRFLRQNLTNHAFKTRFDFNWDEIAEAIRERGGEYTHVYINDPMQYRNYKALLYSEFKNEPKFFVHSHFIDNPETPKVPSQFTYWFGQMETAIRCDYNFWQCESAMHIFFGSMKKWYNEDIVEKVKEKSIPWDDGYSQTEMGIIDFNNVRIDIDEFDKMRKGKTVVFIPNRVSKQFDYTNTGKFLFDWVHKLDRDDVIIIVGNPNQKFTNDEIVEKSRHVVKVSDGPLNRDEYKFIAMNSDIIVALYDNDSYGGTALRECVELGCMPLAPNLFEYKRIFDQAGFDIRIKEDLSNTIEVLDELIRHSKAHPTLWFEQQEKMRAVVRMMCSTESTTPRIMEIMGL